MKPGWSQYRTWIALLVIVMLSAMGCAKKPTVQTETQENTSRPAALPTPHSSSDAVAKDIELLPLIENVWIHRSYADVPPWGRTASNGLLVVGKEEALIIDTPWNDAETAWLFAETKRRFNVPVTQVIVTHAHEDRLGGLAEAHRQGAHSYAEQMTVDAARASGRPIPEHGFSKERSIKAAGMTVEMFYPGPGHTKDNIAVYLKEAKILVGGCMIKAADATSLGNTAEADVAHWSSSIDALEARFPNAAVVVPGHGDVGDLRLLAHTRDLVSTHTP